MLLFGKYIIHGKRGEQIMGGGGEIKCCQKIKFV